MIKIHFQELTYNFCILSELYVNSFVKSQLVFIFPWLQDEFKHIIFVKQPKYMFKPENLDFIPHKLTYNSKEMSKLYVTFLFFLKLSSQGKSQ